MAEIILFANSNFHGAHRHVYTDEANLNHSDDDSFNDNVSSIVVLEGNWRFYRDADFKIPYTPVLGPGLYSFVGNFDIENDQISSLKLTSELATVHGAPLNSHAILFENGNFHGAHKHVFTQETNLNAPDDNSFNDKASSIAVLQGNWHFYRNAGFNISYAPVLGPGLYPYVGNLGIENDQISSLRATTEQATVKAATTNNQMILFKKINFRGAHKHVFSAEPNLNAPDDNSFNDSVGSVNAKSGTWDLYENANFDKKIQSIFGPNALYTMKDYSTDFSLSSLKPE
jgi:hypothetical protein